MELWLMIGLIVMLFLSWVFVNAYIRFKFIIDTVGEQLANDYDPTKDPKYIEFINNHEYCIKGISDGTDKR